MNAAIIIFPRAPEPAVDRLETLERAQRRHALGLLSEVFGPEYARKLTALYEAPNAKAHAEAIAALEELP